jgi:hypothetical protein
MLREKHLMKLANGRFCITVKVYDYLENPIKPRIYTALLPALDRSGSAGFYCSPSGIELWEAIHPGEDPTGIWMSSLAPSERAGYEVDHYPLMFANRALRAIFVYAHTHEVRKPKRHWLLRFVNYLLDKMDHSDNE